MNRLLLGLCMTVAFAPTLAADGIDEAIELQDLRAIVEIPKNVRQSMRELMRQHLSDLQEIQQALAESNFNPAADIAEFSLGLSSLGPRNTRQGSYMPAGMRHLGVEMHRASSRLALAAQEADMTKSLAGLSEVTGICVGCHASYRAR